MTLTTPSRGRRGLKYVMSAELLNRASRNALQIGQPNARKPRAALAVAVFPSLDFLVVRWSV
ncbi:hypothetical protein EGH23_22310 [Halomicroarcula sp. F27]|uniref:Uncharacterized protein n=1 Tax=Haloarcula nitratireducens TaxID=2487749 RepID=A0AAW4PIY9_9EURY|nr:hypothetical protein [Halomicroarcula nitratireducens]MBX0297613.1 hypothetical protein [Halomicroarcula nitratireducens]